MRTEYPNTVEKNNKGLRNCEALVPISSEDYKSLLRTYTRYMLQSRESLIGPSGLSSSPGRVKNFNSHTCPDLLWDLTNHFPIRTGVSIALSESDISPPTSAEVKTTLICAPPPPLRP
jgi:hypothetical protein